MKSFVISLGGSLIHPNDIDTDFLLKFKNFIEKNNNYKFYLICGGGILARKTQNAGSNFNLDQNKKDWLGIQATKFNAYFVKTIFGDNAYDEILTNPTKKINTKKNIIICSGWKPGWSTDYVATIIAKTYNAKTIINLSNIKYVYDKDPKKFKDAKKITSMSWDELKRIVGNKWTPGLNAPFDPIATKEASNNNFKVIIANGKDLDNLQKIINNEKFLGTLISSKQQ